MSVRKQVTLKDVAKAAGVSISTVSHVINNTRFVKPETRQVVEKTMNDLSFDKGKGFSKKAKYIGLIVADITEDYSISVIKSIENHLREINYSIIVCDSQDDLKLEQQNINKLLDNERVSGIIISPVNSNECSPRLKNTKVPVVCFDRKYENVNKVFFGINNLQSGYYASSYLFKHECKNVGFIGYPQEIYSVHQRELGYRLSWQEKYNEKLPKIQKIDYFQENSVEVIQKFIKKNNIDGLICATSGVCHLAIEAIEILRLDIPNDIKIVTYDNNKWFDMLKFPISVVTQPVKKIAEASVDMMIQFIENPNDPNDETSEILFETGFIDRL